MVVAKTVPAQTRLVEALQAREITREYEAVAIGTMTAGGTVEEPIARHSTKRTHMAVHPMGKPAVTHYRIMEHFRAHTRLRLRPKPAVLTRSAYTWLTSAIRWWAIRCTVAVHVRRKALRKPSSTRCAAFDRRAARHHAAFVPPDQRYPDGVACAAAAGHGRSDQRAEGGHRRIQRSDGLVMNSLILPDWPLPPGVKACSTTRGGGVSLPPYDSLNLGTHVGDEEQAVKRNRERLVTVAGLPQMPVWLEQVHGTRVVTLTGQAPADLRADAVYSNVPGQVCAVMTADCLPVLFCSQNGGEVAAAHAGWRGLCHGVLEQTVAAFSAAPGQISTGWGRRSARSSLKSGRRCVPPLSRKTPKPRRRLRRTAISFWLISTYWPANACCGQACRPSMAATAARLTKRVIFLLSTRWNNRTSGKFNLADITY